MKNIRPIILIALCLSAAACKVQESATHTSKITGAASEEYMTIEQAMNSLKVPGVAAEYKQFDVKPDEFPRAFRPPYYSIKPVKLFDNLYFSGTTAVGTFIIDTGEGLIMLDSGCSDLDASMNAEGYRKLGLDLSRIKLILISHEHFDHYGGVMYFKKNVCPDAKVAMSLTGWNMLQTVPPEWAYTGTRPDKADIYLTDGMKIRLGNAYIQVVATPGHSPGCLSFIFPVTDNGEKHMAGVMGGSGVWPTKTETEQYIVSVEYFKAFTEAAGCDVGLFIHSTQRDFTGIYNRKPGEPNPLIIGLEAFNTVYLQKYRDKHKQVINSGKVAPYPVI